MFKEYGSNGEPLAQYYTATGQTLARHMFGNHARKEDGYQGNIRTRGGLMYYQYDGLGNVMDITDRLGSQVMGYRYDAFGNLFTQMAAPYNAVGYTGKTYDAKASLMDYSARWYSPSVGRFTSSDTYQGNPNVPGTLNRYAYVGNNPVNYVDPTGHYPTLQYGDQGTYVSILQTSLNIVDQAGLTVDGIFGSHTDSAVRSFQSRFSLSVDGIVGAETWGEIQYLLSLGNQSGGGSGGSGGGSGGSTGGGSTGGTGGGTGGDSGGGGSSGPPTLQQIIAQRMASLDARTGSKPTTSYTAARSTNNQNLVQTYQRQGVDSNYPNWWMDMGTASNASMLAVGYGDANIDPKMAQDVLTGIFVDTPVDTVKGLWHTVRHPIQTAEGLYQLARHPSKIVAVFNDTQAQFMQSSSYQQGEMLGQFSGSLLLGLIGGGAVSDLGKVRKVSSIVEDTAKGTVNPLERTQYTDKVRAQMSKGAGEYHSFPAIVDNYGALGEKTPITGGDGVKRTKIEISGQYNGNLVYFSTSLNQTVLW